MRPFLDPARNLAGRGLAAERARAWTAELNLKVSTGDSKAGHSPIYRWEPKWYVGSKKRTLYQYIEGERGPPLPEKDRPRIKLTPEAQFRLDSLPDTFREFQSIAIQSTVAA